MILYFNSFTVEDTMIQRTAFKALLEHKGQLSLLGLTCLVESLAIVGQAWFFGTLINNFIFFLKNVSYLYLTVLNSFIYIYSLHLIYFR